MHARLRRTLAATTAALALAALPALAHTPATAAPGLAPAAAAAQPGLPPIGAEIPQSMLAADTPMLIGEELVSVDFRGGIRQRADVNPADPINSVRMRTVGFRVTADLPSADGAESPGTITLEQSDVDVEAESTLTRTQQFPPRYEQRDVIPFTAAIEREGSDPVVLEARKPMVLLGRLTQFPPRGDLYQLAEPVELVDPENPETVVAVLEKFPAKRGGL
ncbi:hypothetical protein O7599_18480 [Streptomyces sp. WMMC500]|uniref:hypothetical protein n=1 Tax=Streptomyces sp. WMMC500 TaxID=3015154 RepID=UPI00248D0864|nr:hypothetical protein [Streptomyces sp. WMMC500]WBB57675.1 hypothetical protein O7599_18480 [Streptomyces sp. WMMC500]